MDQHDEHAKNLLALSAMRQALCFLHRDDHYFDRMYGGTIAQTSLDGGEPRGAILGRFRRILEDTDEKIREIATRPLRDETTSLANPIVKHDLTDKEARDLDALHLALHIFHPSRSPEVGLYERGIIVECMMEDVELKNAFFDTLLEMEQAIHYERRPSSDPEHQAARLAIPLVERAAPRVVPERTPEEEEQALDERLGEMARDADRPARDE